METKRPDFPYREEEAEKLARSNEAMRREDHSDDWATYPKPKPEPDNRYNVGPEEMYSAQYRAGLLAQEDDND